jgi:oligo-alginate lyase
MWLKKQEIEWYRKIIIVLLISFHFSGMPYAIGQTVYPLTGHPRLFFLTTEETALKEKLKNDPELSKVHNLILTECGKMLTLPVQQRVLTGKRLLSVSREAIRRIAFLSYGYRMTGDGGYATRAETEMLAMAAFSDWNPSHFLDVAEMTLAMAIGYDWLYQSLSPSSRTTIATAIKNKGIEETTGTKANQSWLKDDNNWNQVCNAGISAGVAAVYDENPAYYQPLIDRAVTSVKIPMAVYKYNGAYPEGMGYWDYGTTFNILLIDLLQHMWGTDRDLLSSEGFLKTVDFVTHMQGNATKQLSGGTLKAVNPQPFNFADCGTGVSVLPGMFWLARQAGNTAVLYGEMKKLTFSLTESQSGLTGNRLLPFLLIWSIPLTLINLPVPAETTYLAQGKSAVAALRSGWGTGDIYLAVKGGTPSSNHAHMDIGSFVMEANDVRWAMDFGSSDYNTLETNGVDLWNMSQNSERWDVFRYNNIAHNTLTFNGKKQLVAGNSTIDNLVSTADIKSVEMNLTSLYQNEVSNCQRTAAIVSNRYVEIRDMIRAGPNGLTIRWNLLTQAIPQKVSDKIICLSQSTKKLYLIFDGTDAVTAKAWSTLPPAAYEEKNTDTYFTGFEFRIPAGTSCTVTVKMVPEGDPVLNGLDLKTTGNPLNENFEAFSTGSLFGGFVSWKTNPASNGTLKAVLGEVVTNPYKTGINTSDQVLRIIRQDDSDAITPANASSVTYRGVQAWGYDLRVNSGSAVEFKYYKNAPGKVGVRIYDGNGNMLLADFTDPYEATSGYSTAQWRTAQFEIGKLDLSKFSFTPSGYLLISPERNSTETYQEKELTLFIDDVKMLPLSTGFSEITRSSTELTAFFDPLTSQICVTRSPLNTSMIRLYDTTGRILKEILVSGSRALIDISQEPPQVFIVKAITSAGTSKSVKVVCNTQFR